MRAGDIGVPSCPRSDMHRRDDWHGNLTLALFLAGLVLLALDVYGARNTPSWLTSRVFYRTYFSGVVLELAAAGLGIAGLDSGKARVGLLLSLLTLVLFVGFCCSLIGLAGMGGTGVHG